MPEPLVQVLQHAQLINAQLDVARLQRILSIYREFINREGVEGGMTVTRDELECLLDFPTENAHVDFLCERFACSADAAPSQRIDLLTLLAALACLCRGSLEQKAKLLFTLVDLDIEDEVVEVELALVVATCANGLHRLGLSGGKVSEVDSMAIAYEAFDFVALDDGEKMTLAMFLKWCIFHPRPRALLDHLSCIFSTCRIISEMRLALNDRLEAKSATANTKITDQSHLDGPPAPAERSDPSITSTVNVILGPVIGQVSSRSACILLECDAEGELICTLTDRLCGSATSLMKRSLRCKQTIFTVHGLSPGRLYDVSIEGLTAPCEGIIQTLLEHSPAFKIIAVASDSFLSGSVVPTASTSSFMNDIVDHFLPHSRGLHADFTIHIGPSVCLTQDLYRAYKLYESSRDASDSLDATIRDCIHRNWNIPGRKALQSRGGNIFFGLGTLSSLVSNSAISLSFLRRAHSIVQEYERVGNGLQLSATLSEKYMWRLQSSVGFLVLDTFENILCDTNSDFACMQESILSSSQWSATELWLNIMKPDPVGEKPIHQQMFASNIKLLVILLDNPLVWEANENDDNTLRHKKQSEQQQLVTSWNLYPNELEKMLALIFRRLNKDPAFRITVVCRGPFAARSIIRETATGLSMDQITLGPVSSGDPAHLQSSFPNEGQLFGGQYTFKHGIPKDSQVADQYCTLNIVPHAEGSVCSSDFYIKSQFDARIVVGPVIGRVTSKSARILVEFDRSIEKLVCVLTDTTTSQRFTSESVIEAFWPTVIKVESLRPGCRYSVSFEGIMSSELRTVGYIQTPPLVSLTTEWIVVNHNEPHNFIDPNAPTYATTQWKRILSYGVPAYNVQSSSRVCTDNDDTLGEKYDARNSYFNPWFHIEGTLLSNPLRNPHLVIHLGGQVNMQRAFPDQELAIIVIKLSSAMQNGSENRAIQEIRHRMQEVYRVAWGIPPLSDMLAYSSNIMLLNEELDLFFSIKRINEAIKLCPSKHIEDSTLAEIASKLRGIAFELWQLYQNQLWVDVNESDLQNISKNSRKLAFSTSFGLCRMVFLNLSNDVHELRSLNKPGMPPPNQQTLMKNSQQQIDSDVSIELFSKATWKILEDALEATTDLNTPSVTASKSKHAVHQLVVVIPGDLIAWTITFSRLRPGIVQMLEKLFAWKIENRKSRDIRIICASERSSSLNFEIRDDKVNEQITLTCIGSISQPRDFQRSQNKQQKSAIVKGYFSKRFAFKSMFIPPTTSVHRATSAVQNTAQTVEPVRCRTYASYQYLTDFRRGFLSESLHFFPPQTSPKAVLGPIIGRIIPTEAPPTDSEDETTVYFSARILLEVNADTLVVCVVTDVLANEEFRVGADLVRDKPHVFCINGLRPGRRYVYRFEGISNSDIRRGSFYTPASASSAINMVSVSSNFPDQMEATQDSLWAVMLERIRVFWCGIDVILHLGGQVPLHEAAMESFQWVQKEEKCRIARSRHGQLMPDDDVALRQKVRRRFQQQYHRSWNLPNIREVLASCSNWFLRAQADIAPFFRNHVALHTNAAQLVLDIAKEVFAEYQLALMETTQAPPIKSSQQDATSVQSTPDLSAAMSFIEPKELELNKAINSSTNGPNEGDSNLIVQPSNRESQDNLDQIVPSVSTTNFIQQGEIGVFFLDMRAVPDDDVITCNNRLSRPLNRQERPVIGEEQWQQFESALKKKKILALLLCMEFPLIYSNAEYVDQQRDALQSKTSEQEETTGSWPLYDRDHLSQHWVACRRQLEQLLSLLFKWKAKRQGRDVVVFSGGMQLGLETLLTEKATRMTVRNFTTGPITRKVGSFDAPTSGIACPMFEGGAKDDLFTFTHTLVKKKNYILTRVAVTAEELARPKKTKGAIEEDSKSTEPAAHSAAIEADFVVDGSSKQQFEAMHPLTKFQRYPSWWAQYLPMGKAVFWDDTVILKAHSDDRMLALRQYLYVERGFSAALEVFYEKYQFAETARMEELRSRHLQHVDLQENLFSVIKELWKTIPEAKRRFMAYFLDPFVRDFLLAHIVPELFAQSGQTFELDFFCNLCREFVFSASLLYLTIEVQQEDARCAKVQACEQAERRRAQELELKVKQDADAEEEAKRLEELRRSDPEEYAKLLLEKRDNAEKEKAGRHKAKLEAKKAARLKEQEEERAIAKEQAKLNLLSQSDPDEYVRRQKLLETRIRKLEDTKQQRAIERAKRKENEEAAKHAPS